MGIPLAVAGTVFAVFSGLAFVLLEETNAPLWVWAVRRIV